MRNKKFILLCLCALTIFFVGREEEKIAIKIKRSPASVKDHIFEPKLETLIDEVDKKSESQLKSNWEVDLHKSYKSDKSLKTVEIKKISEQEIVFHQIKIKAQKVHMKLVKHNGDQSSFLAFVHPKTHKVIKSWSHRQTEIMRDEVKIHVDLDHRFE